MFKGNILSIKLIKNELRKNINLKSVLIILISVFAVILAFGLFLKNTSEEKPDDLSEQEAVLYDALESTDDWKEKYQIQMELNKTLEDFYGEDYVNMQNSLLQYRIDNDIAPKEHGNNAFDFIKFSFSTLGFIIVIIAAFMFTQTLSIEYSNKTEKLVYTKPYSRLQILMSKYLVPLFLVTCLVAFWYLISYIIGGILFSFHDANGKNVIYFSNHIVLTTVFKESLFNTLIILVNSFICGTIAFAVCSISHSRIAGIATALSLYFVGKPVTQKLFSAGAKWVKYLPISYTNFGMFLNSPVDSSFNIKMAIITVLLLLLVLFYAASMALNKRDI